MAATPTAELNDPLAAELHAVLPETRTAATVVPALLGFRSIFDGEPSAHQKFAEVLIHWCSIIDTHGLDGLRSEINHG